MTEKRVMKLASRGKRFGAACIDSIVPFVSYLLYTAVMAANGIRAGLPGYGFGNEFGYDYGYGYGYGYDLGYGYDIGRNHLNGASAAIMMIVFIILLAYIVCELILFAKGKSIGKAALGLQVVSSTDGKPFRFWKMFFRECFVKSASGSVFGLGYIWVLLDEKNRGWHDKILDSYVVDLKESEKMNLRRKLETARSAAPEPKRPDASETQAESAPVQVAEAEEPVSVIPEVVITEEPVSEVKPEVVEPEDNAASEEAAEAPQAEENAEVPATENIAETAEEDTADLPELSMSMKKEELLEAARKRGIQVSTRATKAAIIEAIEKATEETEN